MYKRGMSVIYKVTGETGVIYSDKHAPRYWVRFNRMDENGYPVTVCVELHESELEAKCADIITAHPAA